MAGSPLSVLMALDSMDAGGTETHVLSLAKALIKIGQRVGIIAADGPMRFRFEDAGCHVYLFEFQPAGASVQTERIVRLQEIMRSEKVDCVHVHQTPSGLFTAKAANLLGIPSIFTVHGTYYPQTALKSLLVYSESVICVSAPLQSYITRFGFPSIVVPNGIDLAEFYPSSGAKLRSDLGISEDAIVLMYASRLAWGKATACDVLLRAMKDLYRYGWDKLELVVVGDGPKYNAISELAEFIQAESGRRFIHMVGKQSQMREYYNASDIVVGTGRVALEAMACEKPVLAIGNHGYFGWVERGNYEQAWLNYFGDHGSSAAYSRYLFASEIADGCRRLEGLRANGIEGRRWVEREFHIDQSIDQMMSVYRSAIGEI